MHVGSKIEYIVQHRIQDYWLDMYGGHDYLKNADKAMKYFKEKSPSTDYRIVKRITTYDDEVVNLDY